MLVVFPEIAPGLMVQSPAGNPDNMTLPFVTVHEGCVIMPTTGAVGFPGCTSTVTLAGDEIHVLSVVLLKSIV